MNHKQKLSYRDVFGYLLIGLSVIMLGKSLMLCFSNDIWYDELFTVGMIEHSYGDLVAFTARDVHPPLYYCIVKSVAELCKLITPTADIVVIAKIVSVLPYFILLLYSVTFIRKRFGIFAGGMFLFCVISMPQLSAYTVEVRMYGWALLFVTAAFLHAYGMIVDAGGTEEETNQGENTVADAENSLHKFTTVWKNHSHIIALVLYGLAAAYTQYFACVAVIMVYLYVLVAFLIKDRKRIRLWLVCVAISIVGYAPWLYALFTQIAAVGENYWILPLSWRSLGGCVKFLMKPAFTNEQLNIVLAALLFIAYIFIYLHLATKLYYSDRVLRKEANSNSNRQEQMTKQWDDFIFITAGIGVLVGLVLFGFAASILFRPIFVYRYMIPALGCFWMSFAVGLDRMAEGVIWKAVASIICALVLLIGLRDYRAFMGEEEYKALMMEDTNEAFRGIGAEDILIFNFDQVQMVTGYYLDNDSYLWYGQPEKLIQEICGNKGGLDENTARIKEWLSQGKKVWFMGSFNSREDIVEGWRTEGLQVEEEWMSSYLLERYWFNLYKLSIDI